MAQVPRRLGEDTGAKAVDYREAPQRLQHEATSYLLREGLLIWFRPRGPFNDGR